ncbi:uncharacterized protein LOC125857421 [Solanum stenotomum]|uniref:uncharacterized protein LOC125857421 n=1 Tax=Solanum stenotomum TaxID=172797 RepID=UPI0020D06731|nr:uncharacterized protein LOC125857421 [Solanum stenotomum]
MNITILLRHSGIWVSDVNYEGYKVDGIVVGESISFMNLKALILTELEINSVRKDIEIRYILEGQLYEDKGALINVMAKYKIKNNFNFRVKRSDKKSYVLVCFSDECGWTLRSSCRKKSDVFKVRYFNSEHTCPMRDMILT